MILLSHPIVPHAGTVRFTSTFRSQETTYLLATFKKIWWGRRLKLPMNIRLMDFIYTSAMGWMSVSLPNSFIEILAPKEIVLGGGAFGRCLGHEDGASQMELAPLQKRDPKEFPCPFCHVSSQWEYHNSRTKKQALTRHQICQNFDLGLPTLLNCCL